MSGFVKTTRELRALVMLLLLFVVMAVTSPDFLTVRNIQNILLQIAVNGIVAAGMTVVIFTGGFDLSVGSVMALAGVLLMKTVSLGVIPAILIATVAGVLVGLINGYLISKARINPFIATLSTMIIIRGIIMGATDAHPISVWNETLFFLGLGSVIGIPVCAFFLVAVVVILHYFVSNYRMGRYILVSGGNVQAGYLAGAPMKAAITAAYSISSASAALAGVLLAARLSTGSPVVAQDAPLLAIAAVVLGGTSLAGGSGSILKTLLGVLILGILSNGLNLLEVSSYYQTIIKGVLVVGVVASDAPGLAQWAQMLRRRVASARIQREHPSLD
ncbi:MAG: ABC transporter permease [Bacillota bacterium]|nr:ABC transporter permease [Bacillota bacterium]